MQYRRRVFHPQTLPDCCGFFLIRKHQDDFLLTMAARLTMNFNIGALLYLQPLPGREMRSMAGKRA
jgi:hypothetical protein